MKKYLVLLFILSILIILITIFIYSPYLTRERGFIVDKVKTFTNRPQKVELEEGVVCTPSPTSISGPYLLIVLDDFGYENKLIDRLHKLPIPINPSIIPFLPYSKDILKKAKEYGLDPLLHLPMEPTNPSLNPGEGAIYTSFSDEEIRKRTENALDAMEGVIGVNNHMGSRATTSERVMKDVIYVVKSHDLFFLDSLTISSSIGYKVARKEGLPELKRDIFLDNYKDEDYIKGQLEKLVKIAEKKGAAIGIGHANAITINTIEDFLPILKKRHITVISLKNYVEKELYSGKN